MDIRNVSLLIKTFPSPDTNKDAHYIYIYIKSSTFVQTATILTESLFLPFPTEANHLALSFATAHRVLLFCFSL